MGDYLDAAYIQSNCGQPVSITSPAAGAGFTYTYSVAEAWKLRCLSFQMVTDANAANRIVYLDIIEPGGLRIGRFSSGFTQTTALTTIYTFSNDIAAYGANAAASIGAPTPNVWLHPGSKITVGVTNVQVGDQISTILLTADQVYSGNYPPGE